MSAECRRLLVAHTAGVNSPDRGTHAKVASTEVPTNGSGFPSWAVGVSTARLPEFPRPVLTNPLG